MTENVGTLLSNSTTPEEKINAANNIITNYNLNLITKEIMPVFNKAMVEILWYSYGCNRHKFLFEYLLNKNIEMFIAIAKYCIDLEKKPTTFWILSQFVSSYEPFYVGRNNFYCHNLTVNAYKNLLDYHNFNIDNLTIPDECKKQIEEYRNEKYGGRSTKAAKK